MSQGLSWATSCRTDVLRSMEMELLYEAEVAAKESGKRRATGRLAFTQSALPIEVADFPGCGNIYPCWQCFPRRLRLREPGSLAASGLGASTQILLDDLSESCAGTGAVDSSWLFSGALIASHRLKRAPGSDRHAHRCPTDAPFQYEELSMARLFELQSREGDGDLLAIVDLDKVCLVRVEK